MVEQPVATRASGISLRRKSSRDSSLAICSPGCRDKTDEMRVGSTIRAQYDQDGPSESNASSTVNAMTRCAVIATLNESEACLLWESDVPRPLTDAPFRIAPHNDSDIDEETTVPLKYLLELLDFEQVPICQTVQSIAASVSGCKELGDRLFQLADFVAAIPYYEHALQMTWKLQVGCTVLIRVSSGHVVLAEVDCLDDDTVDVTISTGDEQVVKRRDVLLCRMETYDALQERILLNLARCLMKLASLVTPSHGTMRPLYLKSAVLASTLALCALEATKVGESDQNNTGGTDVLQYRISALLIRSRAQEDQHKFPHATADIQAILKVDPLHKLAQVAWKRLHQRQLETAKLNKRLARNVSQWVQTAMSHNEQKVGQTCIGDDTETVVMSCSEGAQQKQLTHDHILVTNRYLFLVSVVAVLLFSWLIQKSFS